MNRLCFTFQSLGLCCVHVPSHFLCELLGTMAVLVRQQSKDKNEGRYPRCLAANATLDLFPRPLSIFSASTLFCSLVRRGRERGFVLKQGRGINLSSSVYLVVKGANSE
jgi:hypothetical protein